MPSRRTGWTLLLAGFAAVAVAALLPHAGALSIVDPDGPLAEIHVSRVLPLDCQVMVQGIVYDSPGAESDGEFWGGNPFEDPLMGINACGTYLHVGGTTYGPRVGGFAWGGAPDPTPFTPVGQSVAGSGTAADPARIVTTVAADGGMVTLRQTDAYVGTEGHFTTSIEVTNEGPARSFVVFRGGDCYLEDRAHGDSGDSSYGWRDAATHATACTFLPNVLGTHHIAWVPVSASAGTVSSFEGWWDDVWTHAGWGTPYPDTCICTTETDTGGGLSWSFTLPTGGSATLVSENRFWDAAEPVPPPPPPPVPPPAPYRPPVPGLPYPDPGVEVPDRGDGAPRAEFAVGTGPCGSRAVTLDGLASGDADGHVAAWQWALGDGTRASGPQVRHEFAADGDFTITLTVVDDRGLSGQRQRAVSLRPCAPLQVAAKDAAVEAGSSLHACATASGGRGGPYTFLAEPPAGAAFDAATGCLDWRPGAADAGTRCVPVRVREGATEVSGCLRVTVRLPAAPPPPPPPPPPADGGQGPPVIPVSASTSTQAPKAEAARPAEGASPWWLGLLAVPALLLIALLVARRRR